MHVNVFIQNIKNRLFGKRVVYLDSAASTNIDRLVLAKMYSSSQLFANPSSIHRLGVLARQKIDDSRKVIADFIGAQSNEIVFTASGTESDNLAIMGIIGAAKKSGIKTPHIIITSIEHSAVISLVQNLELKNEISATYLPVNEDGLIDVNSILKYLNENTVLISVHMVNNEIGTLLPIKEISKIIRRKKVSDKSLTYPLIHTDASQATAFIEINVKSLGVDLLSFNGQKMYGPKGIGVLFVKRGVPIEAVFFGGNQEFGLRPGTESVMQIVGLATACAIAKQRMKKDFDNLITLRNYFINQIDNLSNFIEINIYAKNVPVSPHIINVQFKNIFSETLVLYLDSRNIYVSSKSACKTDDPNESYVLKALKYAKMKESKVLDEELEFGSIRFSLGRDTNKNDIDYVVKNLKEVLRILNFEK